MPRRKLSNWSRTSPKTNIWPLLMNSKVFLVRFLMLLGKKNRATTKNKLNNLTTKMEFRLPWIKRDRRERRTSNPPKTMPQEIKQSPISGQQAKTTHLKTMVSPQWAMHSHKDQPKILILRGKRKALLHLMIRTDKQFHHPNPSPPFKVFRTESQSQSWRIRS
jgi:hypothetical protein